MSTVNLYDVLDIQQEATRPEIKSAYKKLVKKFHPDKPDGDEEMFELITHAFNVLYNSKSRKDYDQLYKLSSQSESNFADLKSQSKNFLESQDKSKKKKSKTEAKKDFEKAFNDMDAKHNYKRNYNDIPIDSKDLNRMVNDFTMAREQDDIENIHERIFDEGTLFDQNLFNAAFDSMHKSPDELIPHSGNPEAWNPGNFDNNFGSSFSSIDNYENLYDDNIEGIESKHFGSTKNDIKSKKHLTKEQIRKLQKADYTKNHNFKEKDYNKVLEQRMKDRIQESSRLHDKNFDEFETDSSCGGYGIFDKIGISNVSNLTWENDDELRSKYNKLLEMRKKEL